MLIKVAAVCPPRSLPKNIQFLRPIAHGRNVRSEELLSISSTEGQEWLSIPRPRLYTRRERISHEDRSDTDHGRPSSRNHRPPEPAASLARTTSPAPDRCPTPGPPRPHRARPGRQP